MGASASGRKGENVPIEVVRDGKLLRLFVPRGPLGAKLAKERIAPVLDG